VRHVAGDDHGVDALVSEPVFQFGAGEAPGHVLFDQNVVGPLGDLGVELPFGRAFAERDSVFKQVGVLDHCDGNPSSPGVIHRLEDVGKAGFGVVDGQPPLEVLVLDIDDHQRSTHGTYLLLAG
jgi:hypothetical protein